MHDAMMNVVLGCPSNPSESPRTPSAAAATHRAVMGMQSPLHAPERPVVKSVELAMRARFPPVARNADAMRALSAFVDCSGAWTVVEAARAGLWHLVKHLLLGETYDQVDPFYRQWVYTKATTSAAAAGRLDVIEFLTSRFPGCYVTFAVDEAVRGGHLEILQWLHEHHHNVKWGADEMILAAQHKQLEIARWLYNNVPQSAEVAGLPFVFAAAESGSLDLLILSLAAQPAWDGGTEVPAELLVQAIINSGSLEVLQWILENGDFSGFDSEVIYIDAAAVKGHLDVVKYLTKWDIGSCSPDCVETAAKNGHFETVKWILENRTDGCGSDSLDSLAGTGDVGIVRCIADISTDFFTGEAMSIAAARGHLDVVICLHEIYDDEIDCDEDAMDEAAANGHFDVVKWLHKNRTEGCTTQAMDEAAEHGHFEIVKWLHENRSEGCTVAAMDKAAGNGHFEIAAWLHENRSEGCSSNAIDFAAENGHLQIIKWLHEYYDEGSTTDAMDLAAGNGHLEVLQWLHENTSAGCTNKAMNYASRAGQLGVLKWLRERYEVECSVDNSYRGLDMAAGNSHLETLRWLGETQTVRCTPEAMAFAAGRGFFDMAMILRSEFGCGCSGDAFVAAFRANELEILQWLFAHYPEAAERNPFRFAYGSCTHMNNWLLVESGEFREP